MANLYVTEQNAIIRKTGDRLLEKDGATLAEIPCLKLDAVLLFGNVQFTTQAAAEMLDHGIEMALLTRSGRLRGQLTPPKAKNVELRMAQYERSRDETFCRTLATEIVRAKISNSLALLQRYRKNHPQVDFGSVLEDLGRRQAALEAAADLQSLRGHEGTAARAYFAGLARMLPSALGFNGRNRRPPRDVVNALLSFGYTLVGNELQSLLDGIGFDPYVGLYHQLDYGRPSLALDLLEEFRAPVVDSLTATLFNRRQLGPDDFAGDPRRGIRLTRNGLNTYFTVYEKHLEARRAHEAKEEETSFRDLFRRQAHRLADSLQNGVAYPPFLATC